MEAPPSPLSSRPKRSAVERSAVSGSFLEMFFRPERSDLRFFPSIAQYTHQVQVAFCLADVAHDLLLQKLWRGPAPLLAKAAVK
jgi:hypothetical protein